MSRPTPFQDRVGPWLNACFGETISEDVVERNFRFLEESLELVQALGMSKWQALRVLAHTFSRPEGAADQEVGGVLVTLASLCIANDIDMHEAGETELARIWALVEVIRRKHADKPRAIVSSEERSDLPEVLAPFSDLLDRLSDPEGTSLDDRLVARTVIEILAHEVAQRDDRIARLEAAA